jgi:hypothetical protein
MITIVNVTNEQLAVGLFLYILILVLLLLWVNTG